jgi:hypothetical protein
MATPGIGEGLALRFGVLISIRKRRRRVRRLEVCRLMVAIGSWRRQCEGGGCVWRRSDPFISILTPASALVSKLKPTWLCKSLAANRIKLRIRAAFLVDRDILLSSG